jgi:hypothetical protein
MANSEKIIRDSLIACRNAGIAIDRCGSFVWGSGEVPVSVSWDGAVLWAATRSRRECTYGRLLELLDQDRFWFYRFHIGFEQGTVLIRYDSDMRPQEDDVSRAGARMAKEFRVR